MKQGIQIAAVMLVAASILGCATIDIAGKAGFTKEYIKAGDFTLLSYQRFNKLSGTINIYIEGDGRAWEAKHRLSDDPTPSNPVALKLAALDPADNVVYIARPGQYSPTGIPECNSKYWSGYRFAPEVINSFNIAIDILKEKSRAKYVKLIGYSGGGAIAVLVASKRSDVNALVTVAGNLNPKAFCAYHQISELDGSMDPMDVAQKLAYIPQRHFVGSRDKVVPLAIAESFVKMEGDKDYECITVVDDVSHNNGWQKHWKELLLIPL